MMAGWDDLTDDERVALAAAAKLSYDRERRPYAPGLAILRAALIKLGLVTSPTVRPPLPPLPDAAPTHGKRGRSRR